MTEPRALSAEEIEATRRHRPFAVMEDAKHERTDVCVIDEGIWPCDAAKLLGHIDVERAARQSSDVEALLEAAGRAYDWFTLSSLEYSRKYGEPSPRQSVMLESLRAAIEAGDGSRLTAKDAEPTYTVVERLDRPGNRADGTAGDADHD